MSAGPTTAPSGRDGRPAQDLAAGLLAAALGAAVLLHVRSFPELPGGLPGPALFPGIIGALLVLFGVVLAVRALLARRRATSGAAGTGEATAPPGDPSGTAPPSGPPRSTARGRLDALAVVGAVVAYLLAAETLGFAVTMAGLLFLLMWRLGTRIVVAAGAAVLTTAVIVVLFQRVLLVPLPTGLLG